MLSEVVQWWWRLWATAAQETNPNPWLPALDQLPAFQQVGKVTGALPKDIIKATPASKAPGRDGSTLISRGSPFRLWTVLP